MTHNYRHRSLVNSKRKPHSVRISNSSWNVREMVAFYYNMVPTVRIRPIPRIHLTVRTLLDHTVHMRLTHPMHRTVPIIQAAKPLRGSGGGNGNNFCSGSFFDRSG